METEEFNRLPEKERNRILEYQKIKAQEEGKVLEQNPDGSLIKGFREDLENEKITTKFKDPNLLHETWKELSKDHIGDDNLKLTTFLVMLSGLLENQKRRMSVAITGDSSEGKNNLIEACQKHFPDDVYLYLSSATRSTIEDDIKSARILAFKEINFQREGGENRDLLGIIKQVTEGGTSALKKDLRTGLKTARHEKQEQKTVVYPTTEAERDKEAETRFIFGSVTSNYNKTKKVNDNTCDSFANLDLIFQSSLKSSSWIKRGLEYFCSKKDRYEILIPYSPFLKEQIGGKDIFDHNSPRSMRDLKRILALTCAMTFYFQEQRKVIEYKNRKMLVSEPQDLINVLFLTSEFFNETYSGLDPRLTKVLKYIEFGQWVARDFVQEQLEVSRNTIKDYCGKLADEGLIEGTTGRELNEGEGVKVYDGNKIYYKRRQKGIKKPLLRCQIKELKEHLEAKTGKPIDTFDFSSLSNINEENEEEKGIKNKGVNFGKNVSNPASEEEFDTFLLTPFEKKVPFTDEEIKEAGYSREFLEGVLKNE